MPDEVSAKPLRVMLVEDHAAFRQSLAFMLGQQPRFEVVAEVGTLAEARIALDGRAASEEINVAVVDLSLPDGNGADLIEDLHRSNPEVIVLVLSATLSQANLARAVEAGADGVLDKLAGLVEIVGEVRRLVAGAALPSQEQVAKALGLADQRRDPGREARATVGRLTPREVEVLQALAEGLDSEGVAQWLGITVEDERAQVASILGKLGARSVLHALTIAARHGIVEIR